MLQAFSAVESYGVHLVVANELHSRKDRLWLVAQAAEAQVPGTHAVAHAALMSASCLIAHGRVPHAE